MIHIVDVREARCPRCRLVRAGFDFEYTPARFRQYLCFRCFVWRLWDCMLAVRVARRSE